MFPLELCFNSVPVYYYKYKNSRISSPLPASIVQFIYLNKRNQGQRKKNRQTNDGTCSLAQSLSVFDVFIFLTQQMILLLYYSWIWWNIKKMNALLAHNHHKMSPFLNWCFPRTVYIIGKIVLVYFCALL